MKKRTKPGGSSETVFDAYRANRDAIARWLLHAFVREEDVEDVLQEAFLRASQAEASGEIRSPRAYLFITARNIVYKDLKRRARFVSGAIDDIEVAAHGPLPDIEAHDR